MSTAPAKQAAPAKADKAPKTAASKPAKPAATQRTKTATPKPASAAAPRPKHTESRLAQVLVEPIVSEIGDVAPDPLRHDVGRLGTSLHRTATGQQDGREQEGSDGDESARGEHGWLRGSGAHRQRAGVQNPNRGSYAAWWSTRSITGRRSPLL